MNKRELFVIIILVISAVSSSLIMNEVTRSSSEISIASVLEKGSTYADKHVERAFHLLEHGTLGDEHEPFFGGFARGPVEASSIALAFLLFGKNMWSVWILQMIYFCGSVVLLYAISKKFLTGWWNVVPPLMLAWFWGASLYVFQVNSETLALLLITGIVYTLVQKTTYKSMIFAGALFSLLILIKPLYEYFVPILLLAVVYKMHWRYAVAMLLTIIVLVGGWHVRNYIMFGTHSIAGGGHILYIRALSATYDTHLALGVTSASVVGDYITDKFFDGFAATGEPRTTDHGVVNILRPQMRDEGYTEFETDEIFFSKAVEIIREHPIQYLVMTPSWFFRLNSVPRYNGGMINRMFVGTHENLSSSIKIALILLMRIPWLVFVGAVFWALWQFRYAEYAIWPLLIIVLVNVSHSLVAHAEVRYVLTAMPFYFLFFTLFIYYVWEKYKVWITFRP